jgi:putative SOS response-associated peptidase YedK
MNRYRIDASQAELRLKFGIVVVREPDPAIESEVTPKSPAYVIRNYGGLILDTMSWGFQPATRNRSVVHEGNLLSPAWRAAIERPDRRCLVPATSYCEMTAKAGADGQRQKKWVSLPGHPIFAFAGVWSSFLEGRAFALLTTTANALLSPLQPSSMPVILHEQDYDTWLTGTPEEVSILIQPYSSKEMAIE